MIRPEMCGSSAEKSKGSGGRTYFAIEGISLSGVSASWDERRLARRGAAVAGRAGGPEDLRVRLDRRLERPPVAAAQRDHDRQAAGLAGGEDPGVARGQAVEAQAQPAEAVVLVGVDAGLVEDEVRAVAIERRLEVAIEHAQVWRVADPVLELDVE